MGNFIENLNRELRKESTGSFSTLQAHLIQKISLRNQQRECGTFILYYIIW